MDRRELFHQIECILFVSGEPVSVAALAKTFEVKDPEMQSLLREMEEEYRREERGIQLLVTEESAQLVSNKEYISIVEKLIQPEKNKNASKSMLETLAIVAYKQPVTRAEVEGIRGVLCDYALTQLQKMGLVISLGPKDVPGRPLLYGTTDKFLRKFGLHSLEELPDFRAFREEGAEDAEEIPVV